MLKQEISLRMATVNDAQALLEIYAPYVRDTAVTFEYDVPTPDEFAGRIGRTLSFYPWIVAQLDGRAIGYAYASAFKGRRAYDWAVETSIYVNRAFRGMGVGRMLHDALQEILRRQGIVNMCACIAMPDGDGDATLDFTSLRFHERMNYRMVGKFLQCANKFGRWYNMVWMEKHINEHCPNPADVLPVGKVDVEDILC